MEFKFQSERQFNFPYGTVFAFFCWEYWCWDCPGGLIPVLMVVRIRQYVPLNLPLSACPLHFNLILFLSGQVGYDRDLTPIQTNRRLLR